MNDKEILSWIQEHVFGIWLEGYNGSDYYLIEWYDQDHIDKEYRTYGFDLSDAVIRAAVNGETKENQTLPLED